MNIRTLLMLVLGLAILAPEALFAQPGYMRGSSYRKGRSRSETRRERRPKKEKKARRRKAKDEEGVVEIQPSGSTKEDIEAYLQRRLAKLKKEHDSQQGFGRGMTAAWKKFWSDAYEERKLFEVRMARQRLNLFESLASLSPDYHAETVANFEKLQGTQIRSFEDDQLKKMAEYMTRQMGDLRNFADEQEKGYSGFVAEADAAWRAQKVSDRKEESEE